MKRSYTFLVTKGIDEYYIGSVPELPGVYTQAKTLEKLFPRIKEAIEVYIEAMEEQHSVYEDIKFVGVNQVEVDVG